MATVLMPSSRQAEMIRSAISPRLAIRIFLNMRGRDAGCGTRDAKDGLTCPDLESRVPSPESRPSGGKPDGEELLPVLDGLTVTREDLHDLPVHIGLDLVHQFHRLDDAKDLAPRDLLPNVGEGIRLRRRGSVERSHDRGTDDVKPLIGL